MPAKLTAPELRERCAKVHRNRYVYPESAFDGKTTKSRIEIQCPDHGKFSQQIEVHLGLVAKADKQLVAVASFGKPRFNSKHEWELLRFAGKRGLSVVGGMSRLLAHFKKEYRPSSIVSYADLRWGTGKSYENAGFVFERRTAPALWYADVKGQNPRLIHRMRVQKHRLKSLLPTFDPTLSAAANLQVNNFVAIEDCGNNVFVWRARSVQC